jgi:hypothetical protein
MIQPIACYSKIHFLRVIFLRHVLIFFAALNEVKPIAKVLLQVSQNFPMLIAAPTKFS